MSFINYWFGNEEFQTAQITTHIPPEFALKRQCLGLSFEGRLWIVFAKEIQLKDLNWLSYNVKQPFDIAQVKTDALERFSALLHKYSKQIDKEQVNQVQPALSDSVLDTVNENQVVKLVNSILFEAYQQCASDIHFENTAAGLVIKNRIDGVLVENTAISSNIPAEQVISRLKVLAELDIAERRIPQDGRLTVHLENYDIDLRISIMPGLHGEDAVLRILDKQALTQEDIPLTLELLGFDTQTMIQIRKLAKQPYGMMLVTGPTGSGKTTTLYALLHEQHDGQQKIITIEDPVEYQIKGTLQIPVNEKKGLTFARGLRSILRHDPDKILVGEIRDHDTAAIAVQAALTGHLVYTSVHANHALDVIGRFRHMEIDLFGFVSSLNGIVAQRLIRLNCPMCRQPVMIDDDLILFSGILPSEIKNYNFHQGVGCEHCQGTGYKGRQAIAEILIMNDELRELMIQSAPISQIRKKLNEHGMKFLRQQALDVVAQGLSTLQEINRVTFVER
jgi:general secretion pathway protein E